MPCAGPCAGRGELGNAREMFPKKMMSKLPYSVAPLPWRQSQRGPPAAQVGETNSELPLAWVSTSTALSERGPYAAG